MTPEEKLAELGFTLTRRESALPFMALGKVTGNLLYLSGATPPAGWVGRVGDVYTVEQGYEAARLTGYAQLEMAWSVLGDLGRIKQVVKLLGMVNCVPGFTDTPAVMHGCSELYLEVLGEKGKHARSAVGLQALPGNVPIEIETIFEIEV